MHSRMQFTPACMSMIVKALEGQKMLFCVLLEWPYVALSTITGI